MRIAYVLSMARYGLAAWNYREIEVLTKAGFEIWAYPLTWAEGPYMPRPEWRFRRPSALKTVLVQPVAFLRNPARYLQLLALSLRVRALPEFLLAADFSLEMRDSGIEHIHCHFGDRKLFTGYFCSLLLNLPLSVTVHAYEILRNPNPALFRIAAAHCNTVVTVSEFNKREIVREFGISEDRIKVIHLHGDVADRKSERSVKLLTVAAFVEKKGHNVLFEALRRLNRPDITLWLAGSGKLDVKKLAAEAGVAHQTRFLGALEEDVLSIVYDACDIFVLPSRTAYDGDREGIPVALMEAMSHGKAVISTLHAGIPELVPEILVPENDPDALADAIAYLADNPDARAEQGRRNREIIEREFSEAAVLRLAEVFRQSGHFDTNDV